MQYDITFEVCGFMLLSIVLGYSVKTRNFSSLRNNFFAAFSVVAILDIVFDILSVFTIGYAASVPLFLNYVTNTAYMMLQSLMPAMLFVYILVLCGVYSPRNLYLPVLMLPLFFIGVSLIMNIYTRALFYFDGGVYYHGPLFFVMYIVCGFYFAAALVAMTIYRKHMRAIEYTTVYICTAICAGAVILQIIFPRYLLTGLAVALAITMMYMTLQNTSARKDDLTGLNDRSGMLMFLEDRISRRKKVSLFAFSVDETKALNSLFGPANVTEFFVGLSDYLKRYMNNATLFRISGDTFAVVCMSSADCIANLELVKNRFEHPWLVSPLEMHASACMCYMTDIGADRSADELLIIIEQMLLKCKRPARGRVIEITGAELAVLEREMQIEAALYEAVGNDSFEVYLQPIFSTAGKRFTGAEALVRLTHEKLGVISPGEFIPLAENNGLIIDVGQKVLEKVCRFIRDNDIINRMPDFECIEVNLSAVELSQTSFPQKALDMMHEYSVPPSFIMFEITETIATTAYSMVRTNMELLREYDVGFALDDYGTGYANVDSMIRLPFTTIKLDRKMLVRSFDDPKNSMIFERTVSLIRDLGLKTIVEGAETLLQVMSLQEMGVDNIQGFYYAQPMPMDEFAVFLGLADASRQESGI